jgi:YD repeat-containing protein
LHSTKSPDPFDFLTSYEYDVAGNTTNMTQSAAGSDLVVSTETEYDEFGRKTAEIDPVGNRTAYEYDSQGRLWKVILPAVPDSQNGGALTNPVYEYRYDASGNQTHIIDPYGHTTVFRFDAAGRQLTRTLPLGFGPDGIASASELSTLNSQPSTFPFTESFRYDDRGRQYLHVSFEGDVTESVFDGRE